MSQGNSQSAAEAKVLLQETLGAIAPTHPFDQDRADVVRLARPFVAKADALRRSKERAALGPMGLLLMAVVISSCSGNNDAGNVPQSVVTTAPAPSTPTSTQKPDQAKVLEIKAGQSPEELAKSFISVSNKWTNAGCDEETSKESDSQTSITLEEFSQKKATELATPYVVALYGPDYQANPNAMNYLASGIKINADVMKLYIMSDPASNKDVKAHYKQTENFDGMVSSSQTGDTTTLIFDGHFENNSQDAHTVITETPSGQKVRYTIQFKEVNGVERVVSVSSMKL